MAGHVSSLYKIWNILPQLEAKFGYSDLSKALKHTFIVPAHQYDDEDLDAPSVLEFDPAKCFVPLDEMLTEEKESEFKIKRFEHLLDITVLPQVCSRLTVFDIFCNASVFASGIMGEALRICKKFCRQNRDKDSVQAQLFVGSLQSDWKEKAHQKMERGFIGCV